MYETVAAAAGLNIIFDADFRNSTNASIRIENADILEAFDILAAQTGTFVEVLDDKTVIVAPNNVTKRREYELQVLKVFRLSNVATQEGIAQIIGTLRSALNARYVAQSTAANAIVVRDTPDRIAIAEKTIAELDKSSGSTVQGTAIATNAAGGVFINQSGNIRRLSPARSSLQTKATGLRSFKMDQDSRASFEEIAKAAGLNIIFDRDFRNVPIQFKADNVDILDALDDLALQTRSFWSVLNSETIIVAPDNQTKRRVLERHILKTFYLPAISLSGLTEIATALRTLLNTRYIAIAQGAGALVVRDTAVQLVLVEQLIAELTGTVAVSTEIPLGAENNTILKSRDTRALTSSQAQLRQLQPRTTNPLSIAMNENVRRSYEEIAGLAGLRVVFDNRFMEGGSTPLKLENVDVMDALDFLSLQTGNIWEVMDSNTIVIGPDNQAVRKDLERRIAKTIIVNNADPRGMVEIITALRTILNLTQVATTANAIVVEDTPANVALAERMIANLDRPRK